MTGVRIVLYEGVAGHEAFAALSAFRAAGLDADLVAEDALVATREGARIVPARLGYDALGEAACVVLPGGDVARPLRDAALAQALRARRGRWLLVSGEARRVAHALGLLDGRRVAQRPGEDTLTRTQVSSARLVADGRLLTCTGGDALADLALHFVAREHGEEVARRAADALGREFQPFVMGATER